MSIRRRKWSYYVFCQYRRTEGYNDDVPQWVWEAARLYEFDVNRYRRDEQEDADGFVSYGTD